MLGNIRSPRADTTVVAVISHRSPGYSLRVKWGHLLRERKRTLEVALVPSIHLRRAKQVERGRHKHLILIRIFGALIEYAVQILPPPHTELIVYIRRI